jgi:hypothetical protein
MKKDQRVYKFSHLRNGDGSPKHKQKNRDEELAGVGK